MHACVYGQTEGQGTERGHRHSDMAITGALHSPGLVHTSGALLALHSSANLSRIQ